MESNKTLPKSWIWVNIGDLGTIASGGTPSTKISEYFNGNFAWITPADLTGYQNKFISRGKRNISNKGLINSSARLLPKGTILFSSRAPIGYVAISSNLIATNQGFKNLIPSKEIFNEYVFYYFKYAKGLIESMASGTTFKEVSAKVFAKIPIPLPPLPEQHRIVAKIEELFSELDAGVEALNKLTGFYSTIISDLGKISLLKQSILNQAFSGKLVPQNPGDEPVEKLLERIRKLKDLK